MQCSLVAVAKLASDVDEIHLLCVLEERLFGIRFGIVDEEKETEARMLVKQGREFLEANTRAKLTPCLLPHKDARTAICEKAAALDADCVVVGARGQSLLEGMLLGSVSQHVMLHAPCPVLVVREEGEPASARKRAIRHVGTHHRLPPME
jgi:nucleotide-binding universal stress UspA family protein